MKQILGQKRAIATLRKAFDSGRRQHAWVFSGPRGIGKFTTAASLSGELLNATDAGVDAHPDFHVIRKEHAAHAQNPSLQRRKQTNIPIDLLRERMLGGRTSDDRTHEPLVFKTAVSGSMKCFIIDEAELLDESAQNALLKTLEEPPDDTCIMLITSRPDRLLPTVHSRCQHVSFATLAPPDMKQWVQEVDFDVPPDELDWCIAYADGSPGLVIEAIDADLYSLSQNIKPLLRGFGGGGFQSGWVEAIIAFMGDLADRRIKKNPATSKEATNRLAVELVVRSFSREVRALLDVGRSADAISAAVILSDIERLVATNISIKVLAESLVTRWSYGGVGRAELCPLSDQEY